MNRVFSTLVILICFNISFLHAQDKEKKAQNIKKGWTFGAVPAIAYDSDIGFRYGGLVNFYGQYVVSGSELGCGHIDQFEFTFV